MRIGNMDDESLIGVFVAIVVLFCVVAGISLIVYAIAWVTPVEEIAVDNPIISSRMEDHSYNDKFGYHEVYNRGYYIDVNGRLLRTENLAWANKIATGKYKVAVNIFDEIIHIYRIHEVVISLPIIPGHFEPNFNVDRMQFSIGLTL